MEKKSIKIRVLRHSGTDLLMAMSDDMPGLVVHARSDGELERKLPIAVRDLFEASGFTVASVSLLRDESAAPANFGPPAFIVNASFSAQSVAHQ